QQDFALPDTIAEADPEVFESAMVDADNAVDALALDTERATQLQACQHELARLAQVRGALQKQIDELLHEQHKRQQRWQADLQEATMPALSPGEARDWLAVLENTRAACERVHILQTQL